MGKRASSGRRGRLLLTAALVVALLGAAGVPALNALRYSPAQTVLRYFHALEAGDSGTALSLLRAPSGPAGGISDAVLENAAALPSRASVDSVSRSDDGARVRVSYVLGSTTHGLDLDLVPGPKTWGMFGSWAIDVPKWSAIDLSGGASSITLGGQDVSGAATTLPVLFPAAYTVGGNAKYLDSTPVRAEVLQPGKSAPVTLTGKPTAALNRAVTAQLRTQLDRCARQHVLMPTGCLVGYHTTAEILGSVTWKVKRYPDVSIKSDSDGLTMRPATAVYTISGRYRDAVTAHESKFSEDVKATISGTVRLSGDAVTFTQPTTTDELSDAG